MSASILNSAVYQASGRQRFHSRIGLLFTAVLFVVGMLSLFRHSWLPGQYLALGGEGDGTIVLATLEHWRSVFIGSAASWRTPGWFWPIKDTIGLTDTYALFALPYTAARQIGLSMFRAFDCAVGAFSVAGFWGFVILMRRLGVQWAFAAAFGFVFAFGSLVTMKLGHTQTYTIMLAPILGLLLLASWRSTGWRAVSYGALAGLWSGAITLTAPQTAWFLGLDGLIAAVILLVITPPTLWLAHWRRLALLALGGGIGTAIGMAPVFAVYAGTVAHNARPWTEVWVFLPSLTDLANVQPGNFLWHHLLYRIGVSQTEGRPNAEIALGFTPGLLVSALVGCVLLIVRLFVRRDRREWDGLALACLLTPFAAWLLTVQVGGHSAWLGVWLYLPGAQGIRTPFRIQLASLFLLCAATSYAFSQSIAGLRTSRARLDICLPVLAALCVAEQAMVGPSTIDPQKTTHWLELSDHPPAGCRVFYLLPRGDDSLSWPVRQADAMLLSQVIGLPTVNGNSSWTPPGWDLFEPDRPGYETRVRDWLGAHPLDGLCGVEPREGKWVVGPPPASGR